MSRVLDSANYCAKCGCDLAHGDEQNVRSPYDEDVCWWCDSQPMLTDEVACECEGEPQDQEMTA